MKLLSCLKVALVTTLNIVVYAMTLGNYIWLEGRVCRGVFMNWIRHFRYAPRKFVRPTTEEKIVEWVKMPGSVRVFGAGHSFNTGIVSDHTLISLDNYSGLISKNLDKNQITVKGGTRVRDVVKLLFDEGLAFSGLPSHDAQSIAGILSTDVHGTGKIFATEEELRASVGKWGFVSQSVERLKLINGKAEVHECEPSDDLFRAAVGGVGAVGIISEVVVQGVERFAIEQEVQTADIAFVKENLNRLLKDNDHLSLFFFPFTDRCRINTWNHKGEKRQKQSVFDNLREFGRHSVDALGAAWAANLIAYVGLLPVLSSLMYGFERSSRLELESNKAFNRTIYHLHQELEFTVPFEETFTAYARFKELYEKMYRSSGLPYALFEVRFTPPEHDRTLIGAGRGRCCTWIGLHCNDSRGFERYFTAAEDLIKEIGGRPHLGKYCEGFGKEDMARLHGDKLVRFLNLIEEHDPDGIFANEFTRRLFGHGA